MKLVESLLKWEAQNMQTSSPKIIVKMPDGRDVEFTQGPGGKARGSYLPQPISMNDNHDVTRIDFRKGDPSWPIKVRYSYLGFMGPLSGGSGTLVIYKDGRIQQQQEWIS